MRRIKFLAISLALLLFVCLDAYSKKNKPPGDFKKAVSLFNDGNYKLAAGEFDLILTRQLSSENKKSAYRYLGKSYEKTGDLDKAISTYQLAAQLFPNDIPILLSLADIYRYVGLMDRARSSYSEILELKPHNFNANTGLAETYYGLGFLSRAEESYKKAISISPDNNSGLRKKYAQCLFKQRKYIQAEASAAKAVKELNSDADAWLLLARIYYENGKKENAFSAVETAMKLDPERKDIILLYSLWLSSAGQAEKAETLAHSVLKKEPNEPLALFAAAFSLMKLGRQNEAANYFKQALKSKETPFIASVSKKMTEIIS